MTTTEPIGEMLMLAGNYAKYGRPHDAWTYLRENDPVAWIDDVEHHYPFWAVTKHADVEEISIRSDIFLSEPRPFVMSKRMEKGAKSTPIKTLVQIDPPLHTKLRKIVSAWFTPRNLSNLETRIQQSAENLVAKMAENGTWEGDFVTEVAAYHPLDLLAALLGLDDEGADFALKLANDLFGSEDPEFQRSSVPKEHVAETMLEMMQFFNKLAEDRKKNPRDDVATVIANATLDDKPLDIGNMFGLFTILITAGHETTRTAMTGGLKAFIDNPGEIEKLRNNPDLRALMADEIVRWTSPVNAFGRTATEDFEIRGKTIKAGETACLFYGSANRDADIFADPFAFKVDRDPNPHLGFGKGRHFCLGSTLARMEMRTFFPEFVKNLKSVELAGEPEHLASNFVTGIKHLPVKCEFKS